MKLFIPRFTKGVFTELSTKAAREAYRLREEQAFGDLDALVEQTPRLLTVVNGLLQELSPLLEAREGWGLSDITLWPVLRSLSIVRGVAFPKNVVSYMAGIADETKIELLFDQAR